METWTNIIPGYRSKTIKHGNVTIVIHRPELTDKERTKRENAVEAALSSYVRNSNT